MPPSLVIFDCDGVLVDSELLAGESMRVSLLELGLEMPIADIRKAFVGLSWADCLIKIESAIDGPLPEGWLERIQLRDQKWFREQLEPVPGIHDLIDVLQKKDMPFCVASSGDVAKMNMTLGVTDLLPFFQDVMFSATMVERGKPHPDLFLHAADQMGHAPENCLVIEDSVHGVTGAVAAGMRVLAYAGDPHNDVEALRAAGGEIVTDMSEVPAAMGLSPK